MQCAYCDHSNRPERQFCGQCGAALMSTCGQCGFQNTEDEQYCGGCGISLSGRSFSLELNALAGLTTKPTAKPRPAPPSARPPALPPHSDRRGSGPRGAARLLGEQFPAGKLPADKSAKDGLGQPGAHYNNPGARANGRIAVERRQLTVLFCDMVNSSELSASLDPEQWRDVLTRYRETCAAVIKQYDGYVARYVGDGIMAYFGFPTPHEQDAERAVLTGLRLVEAVQEVDPGYQGADPLAARIGIATGLVVAGDLVGEQAAAQHAVFGQTPTVARRMQEIAPRDGVMVADETRRLVGQIVSFDAVEAQRLANADITGNAWLAKPGVRTEALPRVERRDDQTSLVGRSSEMHRLRRAWHDAKHGEGQVVVISGEAGIGKSRLADEIRDIVSLDRPTRLTYQCSPYHTATPLFPFEQHLERAARFVRENVNDEASQKWRQLVRNTNKRVTKALPIFGFLHGEEARDTDPGKYVVRKEKTVEALNDLFEELTSTETVFTVFEDAQWTDPTSLEFLDSIVDSVRTRRVMLVITSRNPIARRWKSAPHVHHIELGPLDRDAAGNLVDLVSGIRRPTEEIREAIIDRCDGNPLFARQLTHTMCLEDGTEPDVTLIPDSLRELLNFRLGNNSIERRIAQIASIIGREFDLPTLVLLSEEEEAVVRLALDAMISRELIEPVAGIIDTFAFRHSLIQSAAYDSVLIEQRLTLHSRLGIHLADETTTRTGDNAVIAWHFTRADNHAHASLYWQKAAEHAYARASYPEVIEHAENALSSLAQMPRSLQGDHAEMQLQILLGASHRVLKGFAARSAEEAFLRALQLSDRFTETGPRLDAIRGLFTCYYARGELGRASDLAKLARGLTMPTVRDTAAAVADFLDGAIAFWRGRYVEARDSFESALLVRDEPHEPTLMLSEQIDLEAAILGHLAWTQWMTGNPAQAMQTCDHALECARNTQQPFMAAMTLFWVCATNICMGNANAAARMVEEIKRLSNSNEYEYLKSVVMVLHGQTLVMKNDNAGGLQAMRAGLARMHETQAGIGQPWVLSMVASALAKTGDIDGATSTIDAALTRIQTHGEGHWHAELRRLDGEIATQQGDMSRARDSFRTALEIAKSQGARALELRSMLSLSRLLHRHGPEVGPRLPESANPKATPDATPPTDESNPKNRSRRGL